MARYINADKLKERLMVGSELDPEPCKGFRSALLAMVDSQEDADVVDKARYAELLANAIIVSNALKEYRAADFVKVVRCKDCHYWETETEPIGIECEPGETAHYCYLSKMITRTDDFCNYGERREDV